jgi:phospholipase C
VSSPAPDDAPAASPALSANVRQALADPPRTENASLSDIKHVVLLMQENRSFDHYFGTMPGVRGFGGPSPDQTPPFQPPGHRPHVG